MQQIHLKPTAVPGWLPLNVAGLASPARERGHPCEDGVVTVWSIGECEGGAGFGLLSVTVPQAQTLEPAAFEAAVTEAYQRLLTELDRPEAGHPIRFWNYVPGIGRRDGDEAGLDRYMRFNAGRHAALTRRYPGELGRRMVTASAVGHAGTDLVVHVLTAPRPGTPVENPRQTPAYRYSQTYGPRPPCFARATALPAGLSPQLDRALLIGGTASVLGERSAHAGDLPAQLEETTRNLAALLHAAMDPQHGDEPDQDPLRAVRELRAYIVRPDDTDAIADFLVARFPALHRLELMPARVCRPDLLVEVEGVTKPGFARETRLKAEVERRKPANAGRSVSHPPSAISHRHAPGSAPDTGLSIRHPPSAISHRPAPVPVPSR